MRAEHQLPIVVVGAGSAGVVVASHLAQDPAIRVLLIDNGDQLGGTSLLNYMVGMWGMREDYDWQQLFGCKGWDWESAQRTFSLMPDVLHCVDESDAGDVDKALLAAAVSRKVPMVGNLYRDVLSGRGAGWTALTMKNGKRHSVVETYMSSCSNIANLSIRLHTEVDSVAVNGMRATGVQLTSGELIEARGVVLCAGALASPVLLRRSGIDKPGIGNGLKNHPSIALSFGLRESAQSSVCIGANIRESSSIGIGDINILSMNFVDTQLRVGAIIGGVMQVTSQGNVEYDPNTRSGKVYFNTLSTEHDVLVMRETIRQVHAYAESPQMQSIASNACSDDQGKAAEWLGDASDDQIDVWSREQSGVYSHPACTCAMGSLENESAVVNEFGQVIGFENLWVCDASVLPDLPRANTHLPVVMVANRIGAMLREKFRR